jgi:hypothetical protein
MAYTKYNATLDNKVNTLTFWNFSDETKEPVAFDTDTRLYIYNLETKEYIVNGSGTVDAHIFAVIVDLSNVTEGVFHDYDHPTYEHAYSIRSPSTTYVYGKLNIVSIP